MWSAKALASLCICTDSPEPLLHKNKIRSKTLCYVLAHLLYIHFIEHLFSLSFSLFYDFWQEKVQRGLVSGYPACFL